MTRVLVLGDTHLGPATLDRMPVGVWDLAAGADLVLHTGDVVHPAVLDALAERSGAEVVAVLGNNDHGPGPSLADRLPEAVERTVGGVAVAMLHDSGARVGRAARMARRFPGAAVVAFGHSHDPLLEPVPDGPLLVNPGSPTQRRRQPVHTVAVLDLGGGEVRAAELVEVGPLATGPAAVRPAWWA